MPDESGDKPSNAISEPLISGRKLSRDEALRLLDDLKQDGWRLDVHRGQSPVPYVEILAIDRSRSPHRVILQSVGLTTTTRVALEKITGITLIERPIASEDLASGKEYTGYTSIVQILSRLRGSFHSVVLTVDSIEWPSVQIIGMTPTQVICRTKPEDAPPQDHMIELRRISKVVVK